MSQIVVTCRKLSWRLSQIVVTFFFPSPSRRPQCWIIINVSCWHCRCLFLVEVCGSMGKRRRRLQLRKNSRMTKKNKRDSMMKKSRRQDTSIMYLFLFGIAVLRDNELYMGFTVFFIARFLKLHFDCSSSFVVIAFGFLLLVNSKCSVLK